MVVVNIMGLKQNPRDSERALIVFAHDPITQPKPQYFIRLKKTTPTNRAWVWNICTFLGQGSWNGVTMTQSPNLNGL